MLLAPSCGGGLEDSLDRTASGGQSTLVHENADLDGLWRGISVPLNPSDLPLEQTLGFASYGEGPDEIRLTHYSFPAPRSSGTIDYLALISFYEVFYSAGGRFQLETRYLGFTGFGTFVDETVTKVLYMDDDLQRMVGTEAIVVRENGNITVLSDSVLALDRQN